MHVEQLAQKLNIKTGFLYQNKAYLCLEGNYCISCLCLTLETSFRPHSDHNKHLEWRSCVKVQGLLRFQKERQRPSRETHRTSWSTVLLFLLFSASDTIVLPAGRRNTLSLLPGAWGLEPGAWGLGPGAWSLGPGALGLGPRAWGPGAWGLGPGA